MESSSSPDPMLFIYSRCLFPRWSSQLLCDDVSIFFGIHRSGEDSPNLLTEKDGRRRTGQTRRRDVSTNQKRFIKVSLGESRRILMSEKAKGTKRAKADAAARLFRFLAKL